MLLTPVAVLCVLEIALRLAGYGPDISLFRRETFGGREFYVLNPEVKSRYFSAVDFNPTTSLDHFPVEKAAGTTRIFCLGGSTTAGFPHGTIGSFSTFLRDRLRATFPERPIEIINLGMTATNSFTTVDIARELPAYQPDAVLVYDGHNEFYGALGVGSHETVGGTLWLSRLYLRLVHLRLFLALRDLYGLVRESAGGSETTFRGGTLMERLARGRYIAHGSETYVTARDNFASNLAELSGICRSAGIPLVLATQVSNLRDQAPFVSEDGLRADPSTWTAYNRRFNHGLEFRMTGSFDSALVEFRAALAMDTMRAESRYALGRVLDTLGRHDEARAAYVRARDLDMLRFRTSTDFNDIIMSEAETGSVFVIDMERVFAGHSPHGLIGHTLMLEHLHPTLYGYFLMGRAYALALREAGIPASPESWPAGDSLFESRLWSRRPSTELDERLARRRVELLTSGWPFRPEESSVRPPPASDTLSRLAEAVLTGTMSWEEAGVRAAEVYKRSGDRERAIRQYGAIISQIPVNVSPYLRQGDLLNDAGRTDEADSVFRLSLEVEKTAKAYRALGVIELNRGKPGTAAPMLAEAVELSTTNQERAASGHLLALALTRTGDEQAAIARLEWVLKIDPGHEPSRSLLAFLKKKVVR